MSYRSESRILHGPDVPASKWDGDTAGVLNGSLTDIYRATSRVTEGALFRDGMDVRVESPTTTYTAGDDGAILVNTGGGAVTVNLPPAGAVPGRVYYVKKTTADANAVTIDPDAAELIEGAGTHVFGASGRDSRTIISDGSTWWILSSGATGGGGATALAYARASTDNDIVNDNTERTLWSFSVAANDMSSNRAMLVYLGGDYLNNTGGNRQFTWRVKLGATTLYDDITVAIPANASRRTWSALMTLGNQATNDQALFGQLLIGEFGSPGGGQTIAGIGDLAGGFSNSSFSGSAAEDTTSAKTFTITIQHSGAANANLSMARRYAMALLV